MRNKRNNFWLLPHLLISFISMSLYASEPKLTELEKEFLLKEKQLTLCSGPDLMPLEKIEQGKHVGMNAEYMNLLSKKINTPIVLVPTSSWEESMQTFKDNGCTIISLVAETKERHNFMLFSETYIKIPFVLVTTQEKFFISKLEGLVNKKLGVIKGYAYVDLLKERFPNINLIEVNNRKKGLELVSDGTIFGYLSGLNLAGYAIQEGGYTNLKINGQFDELDTIKLGVGIQKDKAILQTIFNKAIQSITTDQHRQIANSWVKVRFDIVEDHQRITTVLIAVSIIIAFLSYRQIQLRRHNIQLADREREIWTQANFDFLTGLPNRRLFQDRLAQKVSEARREKIKLAILLIDLDNFKEVNDTLGHDVGDDLLVEAAKRIKKLLRESDTIARLGGDEFVVILGGTKDHAGIETVVENILEELALQFHLNNESAYISASIGITLYPRDTTNPVELMKNADQAMYAAKSRGGNTFHYFTSEMQDVAINRMVLINELRVALTKNQFRVYFQPIVDLHTLQIYKAESLIRWIHPERGVITPIEFIPILEDTRMLINVGDWVFMESADQAKRWREMYHKDFQITVNTSPIQFDIESTLKWNQYLKKLKLPGQAIGIEITEHMLMEGQHDISHYLIELRDSGFQVSLDDFGTGYSSLAHLRKFDIDYLKIEKAFVQNLTPDSDDMALCEAIVVMAHKLGLKVVAEGVETKKQLDLLKSIHCDYAQGYYFSEAVPQEEFELLLTSPWENN